MMRLKNIIKTLDAIELESKAEGHGFLVLSNWQ